MSRVTASDSHDLAEARPVLSLQSGHDISTSAMQRLSLTLIPGLLLLSQVQAWGGVFNR